MTNQNISSKIKAEHLARKATVYLRQSTEKQVQQNTESKRLQYDLVNRAKNLGFQQIDIIDIDLGSSAAIAAARREGFDQLIASVARGEVGIVLSREVSRLSRTDKDWCSLLEVCQIFKTLIGDADQIYDLALLDDQLMLGIKGTMSVVELKILQSRMLAGMEEKARRGEMARLLTPGYVYDDLKKVIKDPDVRVREAIEMVFKKFSEIRSVRQTFIMFQENGIELPVNKSVGKVIKIVWQLPTYSFIKGVLRNPFYAGAYVWGRRPSKKIFKDGTLQKKFGAYLDAEECRVFIPDHHDCYINWNTYKENERLIRGNSLRLEKDENVGAARAGQGILAGLLRCGECGRKMHVRYWGKSGTAARYLCKGDFDSGGRYCLAFGGGNVDKQFSNELLNILSSLGVQASIEAAKQLNSGRDEKINVMLRKIQQLDYETNRAFEQYNEVDPKNRLVAAELERRWNEKLEEAERAKILLSDIESENKFLTEEEEEKIFEIGENFSAVWESDHCSPEMKKKIIRTVIEEIVVNLKKPDDMLCFVIHWKGGVHTQFEMPKPKSGDGHKTSKENIELIREMAARYGDDYIAGVLNKLGRRTGRDNRWTEQRIASVRKRYSIPGQRRTIPNPDILTMGQASKYCNVSETTIKRLVKSRILQKEQIAPWAAWEIKRSDLDSKKIQEIINRLHKTGKLIIEFDDSSNQGTLFNKNIKK